MMSSHDSFGINGLVGLLRALDASKLESLATRFPTFADDLTKGFSQGVPIGESEHGGASAAPTDPNRVDDNKLRASLALALANEVGTAAEAKLVKLRESSSLQRRVKVALTLISGISGASTLAAGAQLLSASAVSGHIAISSTTWWIASLSTLLTAGASVGNGVLQLYTRRTDADLEKLIMQVEKSRFGLRIAANNLSIMVNSGDSKQIAESAGQLNNLAAELHGVLAGIL